MNADQPRSSDGQFQNEIAKDRFWQAALTVEGKIANFFDVTYAGAYMDRPRYTTRDYTDYTDSLRHLRLCIRPALLCPSALAVFFHA